MTKIQKNSKLISDYTCAHYAFEQLCRSESALMGIIVNDEIFSESIRDEAKKIYDELNHLALEVCGVDMDATRAIKDKLSDGDRVVNLKNLFKKES